MTEAPLDDLVARLERERFRADRLYNDALTAVDAAIQSVPSLPTVGPPSDGVRLSEINQRWNIPPPPAAGGSLRARLRRLVWRLMGPPFEAQVRFNAAVTDHLNRRAVADAETSRLVATLVEACRRQFDALAHFESVLVQYLQTITVYVDSKDRSLAGPELRERLALTEERLLALKRDVAGMAGSSDAATTSPQVERPRPLEDRGPGLFDTRVDSVSYLGFEDRFRGARDDIRSRVEDYLPILAAASDVLDVGCGRGELLEALRSGGVPARGIDTNHAMVEQCRNRGLDVERADAVSYLERQKDGSCGGIVAIQVLEHFRAEYLVQFLEQAHRAMRPGAPLVLETINPACWMAFFECFLRDPTHERPLHPDTLRYLVQAAGFRDVDVRFRQPVSDVDRLERVPAAASAPATAGVELAGLVEAVNANVDRLNQKLFASMDYVVVARR